MVLGFNVSGFGLMKILMVKDKHFLKTITKGKDHCFLALMGASYRVVRTAGKRIADKARAPETSGRFKL